MKNSSSKSKGAIKKCITSRMIQVARDTKLDLALLAAKGQDAVGVKIEIFWPEKTRGSLPLSKASTN